MTLTPSAQLFEEKKNDAIQMLARMVPMVFHAKQGTPANEVAVNLVTVAMGSALTSMLAMSSCLPLDHPQHGPKALNLVQAMGNSYVGRLATLGKLSPRGDSHFLPLTVVYQNVPLTFKDPS